MPHDYIEPERRYRFNGRLVSHLEVRREIEKLSAFVSKQAALIASRYAAGEISIIEFEIEMRELLKAGHIIAASVGRGGRSRMTAADWGRVGAKIKWQYAYLAKFARRIATGRITKIATVSRSRSYASSIYISYARAFRESQIEFIDGGGNANPRNTMLVRLITHSREGCPECAADEDRGWVPVTEMKELGRRICGDFCLCTLEFEDEV